jgi:hypothetical protein
MAEKKNLSSLIVSEEKRKRPRGKKKIQRFAYSGTMAVSA